MFNPGSSLQDLLDAPLRPGRLAWIGLRTERHGPIAETSEAQITLEDGLVGDRWAGRPGGKRQVTLIAREDLAAVAAFLGLAEIPPAVLRRNLLIEGINPLALKERRIAIGEAILEVTDECHPCSRMEAALGVGGYNAMRGRGGLTTRVIRGGIIRVGDAVSRLNGAAGED